MLVIQWLRGGYSMVKCCLFNDQRVGNLIVGYIMCVCLLFAGCVRYLMVVVGNLMVICWLSNGDVLVI